MDVGDSVISATSLGFQMWSTNHVITDKSSETNNSNNNDNNQPAIVSILVSKNTGRYRIQSDSLPALLLIVVELEKRLNKSIKGVLINKEEIPENRIVTCEDEYPLQEYFSCMKSHFELRITLGEKLSNLNNSAHQFRMIQKRLLVRFKDKNPTPLLGLDTLMRESYDSLLKISKLLLIFFAL